MIKEFKEDYRFLSNFYFAGIKYEGILYPSVEHAYQAAKTENLTRRKFVSSLLTPAEAKRYGRSIKLRKDWEDVKISIMKELLIIKFSEVILFRMLIATGDQELQEGNWWGDRFWGVDLKTGQRRNELGKLLMEIRKEIKQ